MAGSGILFAVDKAVVDRLRGTDIEKRPEFVSRELDEVYFEEFPECTCELEDSWEAIHRTLTDGSFCFDCEGYPDGIAVLGGEELYFDGEKHTDHIISLKTPEQVKAVAKRLAVIGERSFSVRYDKIPAEEYPDKSKADCESAFEYLCDSVPFWRYAAAKGLWVLFTASL